MSFWSARGRIRAYWFPLALLWDSRLLLVLSSAVAFVRHSAPCSVMQLHREYHHCSVRDFRVSRRTFPFPNLVYHRSQSFLSSNGIATQEIPTGGSLAVLSQKPLPSNATALQMLSFYHFEELLDPLQTRDDLFESVLNIPGLRGTFYLAKEGINAQLALPPGEPLETLLQACSKALPFDPFATQSPNLGDIVGIETPTFSRLIVRVRDFILRDRIPDDIGSSLDWADAGLELSPSNWHDQLQDDGSVLIDCRNLYESEQGTFDGAIPLVTNTFQDSWKKLDLLTAEMPKDEPVHIFCTGGIRCVKVGAYRKQHLNFSDVRRLEHGIIGYEKYVEKNQTLGTSIFRGENFLFDKRRMEEKNKEDLQF